MIELSVVSHSFTCLSPFLSHISKGGQVTIPTSLTEEDSSQSSDPFRPRHALQRSPQVSISTLSSSLRHHVTINDSVVINKSYCMDKLS